MQVIKQGINAPQPVAKQIAIIYAGVNGHLDDIPEDQVGAFEEQLHDALDSSYTDFAALINERKEIDDEVKETLERLLEDFKRTFRGE